MRVVRQELTKSSSLILERKRVSSSQQLLIRRNMRLLEKELDRIASCHLKIWMVGISQERANVNR
jgi:hypothetical protein